MLSRLQSFNDDNEDGFTLIEILVVILIIGILSAIAIPIYMNQKKKAVDAQLQSEMRQVVQYLETWKIDHPNEPYPRFANGWKSGTSVISSNWPDELKISENVQIITSDSSNFAGYYGGKNGAPGEGYCVEGQATNSNFLINDNNQRMWYNSLKGGFSENCTL